MNIEKENEMAEFVPTGLSNRFAAVKFAILSY